MWKHAEELIDFLDRHLCTKFQETTEWLLSTPEEAISKLKDLRSAYLAELYGMSLDQLLIATHDAMSEQDQDRPFNRFGTDADYEHFGRCPYLTVPEAVALSLGKDPRVVDWPMVQPYLGTSLFAYAYAIGTRHAAAMPGCTKNHGRRARAGYSAATGRSGSRCDGDTGSDRHGQNGIIAVADARLAG